MTDLDNLIARVEAATAEEQYECVHNAINYAHEYGWLSDAQWSAAKAMLNVNAYESAALLLMPEGWRGKLCFGDWSKSRQGHANVAMWNNDYERRESMFGVGSDAATYALAITAAALKARREA